VSKKKEPERAEYLNSLDVYIDDVWHLGRGDGRKVYYRKNGTAYVNWYGRRLDVDLEEESYRRQRYMVATLDLFATTDENGLIHGITREPMTLDQFRQWCDPEFYAYCHEPEQLAEEAEFQAFSDGLKLAGEIIRQETSIEATAALEDYLERLNAPVENRPTQEVDGILAELAG
jgi:hypothetical protein